MGLLVSGITHLFTPAVESCFHLPPGLRIVAPLHQGVVVGIFQRHLVLPLCCPLQTTEIDFSEASFAR